LFESVHVSDATASTVLLEPRRIAIKDDEMTNHPGCVLASTRERPSPVDDEAVTRFYGDPRRGKCDCGDRIDVIILISCDA
jgi:hypothetical protein